MRILVVGAGAVGGYFGGRLAAAGQDVTFLVRPGRAEKLARDGLIINSARGNLALRDVKTILAGVAAEPFDLVLLSCKAYSLDDAIDSFAPLVGESTLILPMLNGMRHIDVLKEKFGASRVLGGQCVIAATLSPEQHIMHLNETHAITFGELEGGTSERVEAIADAMADANFDAVVSDNILLRMWEKWVFLATLAASTCLMRGSVGDILAAPDGKRIIENLLGECRGVAEHTGFTMGPDFDARATQTLFTPSPLTASMLRDVENHSHTEADHILGDLISRGGDAQKGEHGLSLLRIAYSHLKTYEARQARTS
ncbi:MULTISPECIES: 2-dehydropantoate 2-reductase [Paraburkholderia]|jgi:2-dehydropantoate 2-reductase|uniref:2-dehydropantoate 2-reductase n=1 Tax=Paraburkholderia TaxID=1822464 RepID=UPI00190DE774|nr:MULTISPECIES: 2-dehydropantoate 2-reductase [Paraburkholderia]MCP2088572.1 2-dehydropantoate 2-reductase [Paraburkholderia sediminicola]MBK3840275.1 2-dehydropantoate 2-reductase [Paraburkholderia aspalathi]MCX4142939.1 2-dehydropantoate 2-reductase [Paraburkholderia aspalathi]MCX4158376.1 2-dehydropantoate 2-reductase [Paraburkholderia aspalathi]MDN7167777.1 2-dehydropantoate 2-reductase [Paraburkholderia sp. SECH2]